MSEHDLDIASPVILPARLTVDPWPPQRGHDPDVCAARVVALAGGREVQVFDIFVNYRTADTRFGAAATYELLARRFGKERIFLDNQSMGPGSVYPKHIRDALESVRVLLVLIGPQWLAVDSQSPGRLLIHRENDWVRREIRTAFARGVPVVPVLLDDAQLPEAAVLPEDVAPLVYRQALEIRHRHLGADIRKLADVIEDMLASSAVTSGRWRRVHEVDDPVPLGIHPSPVRAAPTTGAAGDPALRVPIYVRRDVGDQLAWALTSTSFVLVVGDATAGKSRLAYEVVRDRLPDHWLVVPDRPTELAESVTWARQAGDCVVWLDDLERYLGPDGLTVQMVSNLSRRVVLLGTIRSQEHAQLSPRWERVANEPGQLRSRLGRDVVRLAYEIRLSRRWSETETRRASVSVDPRVTEAARHADEFGIGEYLAAGPQLLSEWRDAWAPGHHPRAAALVAAAVDVCRAGVRRGVGVGLLRQLHGRYLASRGGDALRPEPFDEALGWATETLHATSSLLVPAGRGRYRPFGYLIDAVEADPEQSDIHETTWRALVTRMPASECWHVGNAAYARWLLDIARSAYQRAATAGNWSAELKITDCIGESGRRDDAVATLRGIIDARTRAVGARHPDVAEARQALAGWTGRAGDPRAAARLLSELVHELATTVGPDQPDTLTARHALANWLGRAGRLPDAVAEYQRLVADRIRHDGPDHPHTLTARHELANWLGRSVSPEKALREHEEVAAARTRVLGADHPDTLRSRHRLSRLVCEVRGTDTGLPLLAQVIADRARVLGPDHPDTLRTRSQHVRWTGKAGHLADAVGLAEGLAGDCLRVLGAEHPDTLRARHHHARWTSEAGDHARATTLLRELIADWTRLLGPHHPYTLVSRYRLVHAVDGTGARAEARSLLADLFADDVTTLGEHHPYTDHAREMLVKWDEGRQGGVTDDVV
jgi:TIR domain-containing protein/tetratricopeptide repeat protein